MKSLCASMLFYSLDSMETIQKLPQWNGILAFKHISYPPMPLTMLGEDGADIATNLPCSIIDSHERCLNFYYLLKINPAVCLLIYIMKNINPHIWEAYGMY